MPNSFYPPTRQDQVRPQRNVATPTRGIAGPIRGIAGWAALLLAVAVTSTGCGSDVKSTECAAFVAVVNDGLTKVQKAISTSPDESQPLHLLADEMDAIAERAAATKLSLPKLQKLSSDYQALAKEVAKAAREFATAVENIDREKMKVAQGHISAAVDKEDPLIQEINHFCQTPTR